MVTLHQEALRMRPLLLIAVVSICSPVLAGAQPLQSTPDPVRLALPTSSRLSPRG